MKIKISLIALMLRQMLPITLIALPISCIYLLMTHNVLMWQNSSIAIFILIHSIAIAFTLGRYRSRSFAFIYTRGFTRDELWLNKMITTILSVLIVWLPASLIVWLPIRSAVQDKLFLSPYFPLMMIREASIPWVWLAGYAVLLPLFHYVWIRRAQPLRGEKGVVFLAIAVVIVMAILMLFKNHQQWFIYLVYILSAIMTITCLIAGCILHRNIEVQ
jgi:hypothetical protein